MRWIRAFILVVKSGVALPLIEVERGNLMHHAAAAILRQQERSVAFGFQEHGLGTSTIKSPQAVDLENAISSNDLNRNSDREGLSRPSRLYYNVQVPVVLLGFGEGSK